MYFYKIESPYYEGRITPLKKETSLNSLRVSENVMFLLQMGCIFYNIYLRNTSTDHRTTLTGKFGWHTYIWIDYLEAFHHVGVMSQYVDDRSKSTVRGAYLWHFFIMILVQHASTVQQNLFSRAHP